MLQNTNIPLGELTALNFLLGELPQVSYLMGGGSLPPSMNPTPALGPSGLISMTLRV